jgi:hypothetical protein
MAADTSEAAVLCMLDQSAAFDTFDHEVLLTKLQQMFGYNGAVLNWLKSVFLHGHPVMY